MASFEKLHDPLILHLVNPVGFVGLFDDFLILFVELDYLIKLGLCVALTALAHVIKPKHLALYMIGRIYRLSF